jgi:hypothetical protein
MLSMASKGTRRQQKNVAHLKHGNDILPMEVSRWNTYWSFRIELLVWWHKLRGEVPQAYKPWVDSNDTHQYIWRIIKSISWIHFSALLFMLSYSLKANVPAWYFVATAFACTMATVLMYGILFEFRYAATRGVLAALRPIILVAFIATMLSIFS